MTYSRVNLYHLYTASSLNIRDYRAYEKILSNRDTLALLGEREKGSLYYLVAEFLKHNTPISKLDNFYYSYSIPHIGKEFDLIKIDSEIVLNIELKSENVGLDRIKAQLLRNYNYLKYLSKKMYLFTFISDEKKVYKLNYEQELVEVNINEIISVLTMFNNEYLDIDKLFKASDFLVSPNANPMKFINDQYFLTSQQEFIKNKVLNVVKFNSVIKITGEAGTGKTLLLFDIAKQLCKNEKVLIINCNKPNRAHDVIMHAFNNIVIVTLEDIVNDRNIINKYEYVLIDEAQRMNNELWKSINENLAKKYIFTLDPVQVLTDEEFKNKYSNLIDTLNPIKYTLSNRIRINNSIKAFTYRLFDLTKNQIPLELSYVKVHYASNPVELQTYFKLYQDEYTYIKIPNTSYQTEEIMCVDIDDVLGKDYENVLMILDNNYFYSNKKLSSHNSRKNNYLYLKILYQGLSRTREKVALIVYRNKTLFKELVQALK